MNPDSCCQMMILYKYAVNNHYKKQAVDDCMQLTAPAIKYLTVLKQHHQKLLTTKISASTL